MQVYPMYKAFIEPDLQTAHIKIINKFNPFTGFQSPTYILKVTAPRWVIISLSLVNNSEDNCYLEVCLLTCNFILFSLVFEECDGGSNQVCLVWGTYRECGRDLWYISSATWWRSRVMPIISEDEKQRRKI